jgi:uncharacterized protein (UPF0335 family)
MNETTTVKPSELRQYVEQFERLEIDKQDALEGQKEVMGAAKANGFDTKIIRKIIAMRKKDKDQLAEEEALTEIYRDALGV